MNNELIVDIKDLEKNFNNKPIIKGINLSIARGDIFGLFGPNGSGKTTTFRLIAGLLKPDNVVGQCLGFDVKTEHEKIQSKVGFMSQYFSLYDYLTVKDNLYFIGRLYGIEPIKQSIEDILDLMLLRSYENHLAGSLSGGWKQRLSLACELLKKPELLILDEPTAGVDPNSRQEFWAAINQLSLQGMTILLSTHYMDEALRCNKLAYIAYGEILTRGSIDEIVKNSGMYTWEVSGHPFGDLVENLRKTKHIEQVMMFGNKIHVSGKNAFLLSKALKPYQYDFKFSWRGINPTVEDIFIYLFKEAERKKNAA